MVVSCNTMEKDEKTYKEEKTDKIDTVGDTDNKSLATDDKPISLYDKTEAIVTRQEAANKKAEEILDRQEKLFANQRLAGTGGGHIEVKTLSDEEIESNKRVQMIGEISGAEWAKEKK